MKLFQSRATDPKEMTRRSRGLAQSLAPHIKRNTVNNLLFTGFHGNTPVVLDDKPLSYVKNGYMMNPDVYSVVNIRTRAASAIPPMVLEVVDEKKAREYYRLKHSQRNGVQENFREKAQELRSKAFEEVPDTDDLYKLIERPNPLQAWPEFFENFWGFMDITGNAYAHGVELSDGRISEMWNMPPQLTRIKADKEFEGLIRAYILEYYGQQHPIPAHTVLHIKYWNPDYSIPGSHLYGMSPLRAAALSVASSNDGLQALTSSYRNMGAAGMAFPKDKDVEQLTPAQRDALSKEIQTATGPKFSKSVLVTSVEMGWQSFGLSPVDLQILEALKHVGRSIFSIYGVSSELGNDPDNKTNSNKKESRKGLYMDTVIPQTERIYSELNRFLTKPYRDNEGNLKEARFPKRHIDYDVSAIEALVDDMAKKVDWLARAYWLTLDEKRVAMDYDESDNELAKELWIPAGMMPIGELGFDDMELRELAQNYGLKLNGHAEN
jgi:HK97 family phage portal protein